MSTKRSSLFWIVVLLIVGFFTICALGIIGTTAMVKSLTSSKGSSFSGKNGNIAIVELNDVIMDSYHVNKTLEKAFNDNSIKAIVLRISSPGGAVGPSQEIYEFVKEINEKKPVICSLADVAASGGYYIASACRKIVANPGTMTGSIGVVMHFMNTKELVSWLKLKPFLIKAGKRKDIGNPYRDMTEQEKTFLQEMITQVHDQFKKAVSEGRKISMDIMNEIGDGRILNGEEAKKLNLVDALGGERAAIRLAAEAAGITGKPKAVRPNRYNNRIERFLNQESKNDNSINSLVKSLPIYQNLALKPGQIYYLSPLFINGNM